MRTLVVSNIVSVDGSYEGPGGNVMALDVDAAFDAYDLERIRAAGTVLLGRRYDPLPKIVVSDGRRPRPTTRGTG